MLTVLGEAIVDLVGEGDRRYVAHPGGSPLNVAVGLGRLGQPTSLAARLSGDAFGSLFREHLAAAGVDPRHLVSAQEPSTLAVATLDEAGVASYDFWTEGTADWQWTAAELAGIVDDETVVLHTGSIALELEPGAGRVLDLLRRVRHAGRTAISYDPNVRLARRGSPDEGRRAVERVVALADLVKVSSEDLGWLYPGEDPVLAARRWAGIGPELVVVTAGGDGAVALPAGGQRGAPAGAAGRGGRHGRRRRRLHRRAAGRAGRPRRARPRPPGRPARRGRPARGARPGLPGRGADLRPGRGRPADPGRGAGGRARPRLRSSTTE